MKQPNIQSMYLLLDLRLDNFLSGIYPATTVSFVSTHIWIFYCNPDHILPQFLTLYLPALLQYLCTSYFKFCPNEELQMTIAVTACTQADPATKYILLANEQAD